MLKNSGFLLYSAMALALFLPYQNCAQQSVVTPSINVLDKSNGQVFDGKMRIVHHYVENFTCEGKPAPDAILTRTNATDWYYTFNTPEKCAAIAYQSIQSVQYDESSHTALYNQKTFVPPKPYYVAASEDPNLPDVDNKDGVCADINGVCSLHASVDQAIATSLTAAVNIKIPAGHYMLSSQLMLSLQSPDGYAITIQGADPITTILDGDAKAPHMWVRSYSNAPTTIQNLTFTNGFDPSGMRASAIYYDETRLEVGDPPVNLSSSLNIENCIFSNNKNTNAITATSLSGSLNVSNSVFTGNAFHAIRTLGSQSLSVVDSYFANNSDRGIVADNNVGPVQIKRSSFFANYEGIILNNCKNCLVENVTVVNNRRNGIFIQTDHADPSYDVTINSSTFYGNAYETFNFNVGNIYLTLQDASNKLIINNSIFVQPAANPFPNCEFSLSHSIVANNTIFSDASCGAAGSGNIFADPLLSAVVTSSSSATMTPLPGSPAIDAGSDITCPSTDQRGLPRPIDKLGGGTKCDIGAIEIQ